MTPEGAGNTLYSGIERGPAITEDKGDDAGKRGGSALECGSCDAEPGWGTVLGINEPVVVAFVNTEVADGDLLMSTAPIGERSVTEDVNAPLSIAGKGDAVVDGVDRLPRRSFAQMHSIPILAHRRQHRPAIGPAPSSLAFLKGPISFCDHSVLEDGRELVRGTQRTLRLRHATQAWEARAALGRMYARGMSAGSVSKFALSSAGLLFVVGAGPLIVVDVVVVGREGREGILV